MYEAKVKLCGLGMQITIDTAVETGADYLGFVFHRSSPRNVAPKMIAERTTGLPEHVQTVGVIVDKSDEAIMDILMEFTPHYLQLHGTETPERVAQIRRRFSPKVIKACPIATAEDILHAKMYESVADMLLLDAKAPDGHPVPGGHGKAFDWSMLKGVDFSVPWFLSGGLNAGNVQHAMDISGARMVDVSSGIEKSRGVKDMDKIRDFMLAARGEE